MGLVTMMSCTTLWRSSPIGMLSPVQAKREEFFHLMRLVRRGAAKRWRLYE
ncbi:hypothetical protein R70006_03176 [Paraburkholderia domus]|nr:hypothetical protein R70006_03176 [Paraburkholderia domus]